VQRCQKKNIENGVGKSEKPGKFEEEQPQTGGFWRIIRLPGMCCSCFEEPPNPDFNPPFPGFLPSE